MFHYGSGSRLLPTTDVRGLNPVICKFYITYMLLTVLKRQKEKKNSPGILASFLFFVL